MPNRVDSSTSGSSHSARGANLICFLVSHVYFFVVGGQVYSQTGWGAGRPDLPLLDPPLDSTYKVLPLTHRHTHTHSHTQPPTPTHTRTHAPTHTRAHARTNAPTQITCICTCIDACLHVHV